MHVLKFLCVGMYIRSYVAISVVHVCAMSVYMYRVHKIYVYVYKFVCSIAS